MIRKRIMITGGCGFIGSHVVRAYINRGVDVAVLCRSDECKRLEDVRDEVTFFKGDATDTEFVSVSIKEYKPSAIIHLAAKLKRGDISDEEVFMENVKGAIAIVKAALSEAPSARLVTVGSLEEVAGGHVPFTEDSLTAPLSWYSLSKECVSDIVRYAAQRENLNAIIVRLSVVYGPEQGPGMLIPNCITACLRDEEFSIPSGDQMRNFIYIDDVVNGIIATQESEVKAGSIMHLTGEPEKGITVRDVAGKIKAACNRGSVVYVPLKESQSELMEYAVDSQKTKKALGWNAKVDIDTGLQKTVEWYKKHSI